MVNEWTRDEWKARAEAAERQRDEVQERADQLRDERDGAVQSCITLGRALDEWKSRAEAAEARTAPAVSRADVAEALSRCLNPGMWNVTFPSVVNEVCDLFGVEDGQATDPVLDKAREYLTVMFDYEEPDSASPAEWKAATQMARHVLGQEANDE